MVENKHSKSHFCVEHFVILLKEQLLYNFSYAACVKLQTQTFALTGKKV